MVKIKRLMLVGGRAGNRQRYLQLKNFLEMARFPLLERLCIRVEKFFLENLVRVDIFCDDSLKLLLKNSPCLKSIHLLRKNIEHDFWNISNHLLFEIINELNVYVNFGRIQINYDYKTGLDLSAEGKDHEKQLSFEKYLLERDMSAFDKYQKMKADFSVWLKERSNWNSFDVNELF